MGSELTIYGAPPPGLPPPGPPPLPLEVMRQKMLMGAGILAMFIVLGVAFYACAPSHGTPAGATGPPVLGATLSAEPSSPPPPPTNTSGLTLANPCALLTTTAIATVISEPFDMGTPADAGNGCLWNATSGDGNSVELVVAPDIGIAKASLSPAQIPVAGVGEFAYIDTAQNDRLVFTKAHVEFVLTVTDAAAGVGTRRLVERQLGVAVANAV